MSIKKFLTVMSIMCSIFIFSCPVFALNKTANMVSTFDTKATQLNSVNSSFSVESDKVLQVTNQEDTTKDNKVIASDCVSNDENAEEGDSLDLTIMVVVVLVVGVSLFFMCKKKK